MIPPIRATRRRQNRARHGQGSPRPRRRGRNPSRFSPPSPPCRRRDDHLSRELASVHRCDLALVCSPVETTLLRDRYRVPSEKLIPASFFCDPPPREFPTPGFEPRAGFVTIGTFYHPPNVDSVRWMSEESVAAAVRRARKPPRARSTYPIEATVFGRPPTQTGFLRGRPPQPWRAPWTDARVPVPLRFGAGSRGKSWTRGKTDSPVVTTPAGAEGMVPGAETLWRRWRPNDIDDGEVWGDGPTRCRGDRRRTPWCCTKSRDAWERARERRRTRRGTLRRRRIFAEVRRRRGLFERREQEEVGAGGREGRVAALEGGAGGITWARRL